MTFKLKRTRQCAKCPFKVSTNPEEIPNGYCRTKHENLSKTIATENSPLFPKTINAMACHESGEEEYHCVGWLHNQLGVGNNIALRIQFLNCENIKDLQIVGEQHENFKDTIK